MQIRVPFEFLIIFSQHRFKFFKLLHLSLRIAVARVLILKNPFKVKKSLWNFLMRQYTTKVLTKLRISDRKVSHGLSGCIWCASLCFHGTQRRSYTRIGSYTLTWVAEMLYIQKRGLCHPLWEACDCCDLSCVPWKQSRRTLKGYDSLL